MSFSAILLGRLIILENVYDAGIDMITLFVSIVPVSEEENILCILEAIDS